MDADLTKLQSNTPTQTELLCWRGRGIYYATLGQDIILYIIIIRKSYYSAKFLPNNRTRGPGVTGHGLLQDRSSRGPTPDNLDRHFGCRLILRSRNVLAIYELPSSNEDQMEFRYKHWSSGARPHARAALPV